jgi:hypothetical protein
MALRSTALALHGVVEAIEVLTEQCVVIVFQQAAGASIATDYVSAGVQLINRAFIDFVEELLVVLFSRLETVTGLGRVCHRLALRVHRAEPWFLNPPP